MGNWNISIRGVGCHHNDKPYDVERLTADFVRKLRGEGHTIVAAHVTMGSEVELAPAGPPSMPAKTVDEASARVYGDCNTSGCQIADGRIIHGETCALRSEPKT